VIKGFYTYRTLLLLLLRRCLPPRTAHYWGKYPCLSTNDAPVHNNTGHRYRISLQSVVNNNVALLWYVDGTYAQENANAYELKIRSDKQVSKKVGSIIVIIIIVYYATKAAKTYKIKHTFKNTDHQIKISKVWENTSITSAWQYFLTCETHQYYTYYKLLKLHNSSSQTVSVA